jgi:hypothetical protein
MTTVQIIGVAVASAAVVLLIIALIVTRHHDDEADQARTGPSFLDEAPQDTFANLGKAEVPIEDVTLDPAVRRDDAQTTRESRLDQAPAPAHQDTSPAPGEESGGQATFPEPARPAEGGPAARDEAASESGSGSRLVPLSDIIVTTSNKMVDLQDPEVRRMLTELVTFEIDQAADFRGRGQRIDAVLQLTEAEKVSRALGMTEAAMGIRMMMEEIRLEE